LRCKSLNFVFAAAKSAYFFALLKNKLCANNVLSALTPNILSLIAFAFGDQRIHLWIMTSRKAGRSGGSRRIF
jgi:hypothetical protein